MPWQSLESLNTLLNLHVLQDGEDGCDAGSTITLQLMGTIFKSQRYRPSHLVGWVVTHPQDSS